MDNKKFIISAVAICTFLIIIVVIVTHYLQKQHTIRALTIAALPGEQQAKSQQPVVADVKGFAAHIEEQSNVANPLHC